MIEVGARHGYEAASVGRVIERGGIARSTFYEHFADRDECFLAALELLAGRIAAQVEEAAEHWNAAEAALRAAEAMVEFCAIDPDGGAILFIESLAAGKPALDLREVMKLRLVAVIERRWAGSPGAGGTDLPPVQLIGGVSRLLAMRLRHGEGALAGLGQELGGWIDSYNRAAGPWRWRDGGPRLAEADPLVAVLPALEDPSALPGRHRLSRAEVARGQRLRILRATARCSYEYGYRALSVSEIVAEAKVSRNVFYKHFRNKAEAATQANEEAFHGALSATATAFFVGGEWPERVWAGARSMLSFLARHPADAYQGMVEAHAIGPAAIQVTYDRLAAFSLFLEEGYRLRSQAEQLPRLSSEALAAVMFEMAFAELRAKRKSEGLLATLPVIAYMILAPFMGPEEAMAFVEEKVRESA
jgi:AcrR family transcriptional regulator